MLDVLFLNSSGSSGNGLSRSDCVVDRDEWLYGRRRLLVEPEGPSSNPRLCIFIKDADGGGDLGGCRGDLGGGGSGGMSQSNSLVLGFGHKYTTVAVDLNTSTFSQLLAPFSLTYQRRRHRACSGRLSA